MAGAATLRSDSAREATVSADGVVLRFADGGLDVTLRYTLGADDRFVEKWVEIRAADGKAFVLDSVLL